ncbi:SusD/RagB family nutrient-binding outer membrane lipoprotein [Tunicatimonas pelagia]|uniref:SusD/RagB family nutrient-binding outer membrane lipoprotein n=1 Tax=Tunicatimonas pelagia TaxID=931531 RepID=UPI002666DFDD|nr:SusD/RagB family nutrient-binding outer membrane lipoprotein [Tunicatimonas pelagia]WKN43406.1 SusD/RagB family nutrient-binding outer membrane lipoprotein [Tunicatimonas pelagia]
MHNKILSWGILLLIINLAGCTDDFEEINTNPNRPEEVSADLLLSKVLSTAANENALEAWNRGNIAAQYTAKINFTDFDRYLWEDNGGYWNDLYGNLRDIENILAIARDEESPNPSYEGVALVMKAWTYVELTSLWGDIPFTEAIQGRAEQPILQPQYTPQAEVFAGILDDLQQANDLLQTDGAAVAGDLIFQGDLAKWKKFTNSLRVRVLMRISGKQDVSSDLQEIIANQPLMESNDDNALMEYLPSQPNTWPVHTFRVGSFDEYRLSLTNEGILRGFDDPRLFRWFRPTDRTIGTEGAVYVGMPNGLSENNASTFNGGAQNVSRCSRILYEEPNSVDAVLMQYAELQFLLAEAVQRGLVSGDAQAFYEQGVTSSFDYWEVPMPGGYLSQSGVAYDNSLETIMNQKWLSLFLNGYEAYYDHRRTGFPAAITPGPDNVNSDQVPVRYLYPDDQQTLNTANYQAAIARQGEDNINTQMWLLNN